jgi:lactate dehydrogenase-like 2-hydroxyacid dehydrogenase
LIYCPSELVLSRRLLKYLKRSKVGGCGLDIFDSEQGSMASSCENKNKISSSVECGEFPES